MSQSVHERALQAIDNLEDYALMSGLEPIGPLNVLLNYVLEQLDKDRDLEYDDKRKLSMKIFEMKHRLNGT